MDRKLLFHWKSGMPKNFKKNAIVENHHHSKKIISDLAEEISIIRSKYLKVVYPPMDLVIL